MAYIRQQIWGPKTKSKEPKQPSAENSKRLITDAVTEAKHTM